ncbi:nucleoside-diphosphate-sugar epimerase [Kitasatospora sp. SolWspMP-SS2h]|uniref:NAD-dependent epimerase/dehydratase family protein n=1 Tax=Kitasatospora sp. SolWspMP-SS2h TaxID=1305729 RepID=UPI000DBF960C|nr:NAD-dependent epimerase/dehydratase family protein [Kitasatospora sp. SolWspMP-SS2h]RAJ36143.1 nucleoside-diphosphate-sugar epimerase [Kitasatospora sp. SolWspMP-SS2h]
MRPADRAARRGAVLLTGASGFVGGAVRTELAARGGGPVRLAVRSGAGPTGPDEQPRTADLTRPGTLRGLCTGVDTVLHLASLVSGEPARCRAVNTDGTAALLAEAARAGVRRFVLLSTTAVYGPGPHRGPAEDDLRPAPVSAASATRLAAERLVLAAGGTVLRAPLVYGAGDAWVVPGAAALLAAVPALPDGGTALLSLVDVRELAAVVADLADLPPDAWAARAAGRVHHVTDGAPVRAADLLAAVGRAAGRPVPARALPADACFRLFDAAGGRLSRRQFDLLAVDHWYADRRLRSWLRRPSGPGFAARFADHHDWYCSRLTQAAAQGRSRVSQGRAGHPRTHL